MNNNVADYQKTDNRDSDLATLPSEYARSGAKTALDHVLGSRSRYLGFQSSI
jgi:hypothetical protein